MQQEIVEKLQVLSTGESTVLMPRVPHFVRMVSQKLVRKYLVWETVSHTGARVRVSGYLSQTVETVSVFKPFRSHLALGSELSLRSRLGTSAALTDLSHLVFLYHPPCSRCSPGPPSLDQPPHWSAVDHLQVSPGSLSLPRAGILLCYEIIRLAIGQRTLLGTSLPFFTYKLRGMIPASQNDCNNLKKEFQAHRIKGAQ